MRNRLRPPNTNSITARTTRYYWLLLAEGHLSRRLFGSMLRRIAALPLPGGGFLFMDILRSEAVQAGNDPTVMPGAEDTYQSC